MKNIVERIIIKVLKKLHETKSPQAWEVTDYTDTAKDVMGKLKDDDYSEEEKKVILDTVLKTLSKEKQELVKKNYERQAKEQQPEDGGGDMGGGDMGGGGDFDLGGGEGGKDEGEGDGMDFGDEEKKKSKKPSPDNMKIDDEEPRPSKKQKLNFNKEEKETMRKQVGEFLKLFEWMTRNIDPRMFGPESKKLYLKFLNKDPILNEDTIYTETGGAGLLPMAIITELDNIPGCSMMKQKMKNMLRYIHGADRNLGDKVYNFREHVDVSDACRAVFESTIFPSGGKGGEMKAGEVDDDVPEEDAPSKCSKHTLTADKKKQEKFDMNKTVSEEEEKDEDDDSSSDDSSLDEACSLKSKKKKRTGEGAFSKWKKLKEKK